MTPEAVAFAAEQLGAAVQAVMLERGAKGMQVPAFTIVVSDGFGEASAQVMSNMPQRIDTLQHLVMGSNHMLNKIRSEGAVTNEQAMRTPPVEKKAARGVLHLLQDSPK
jgi:hypothetical protein